MRASRSIASPLRNRTPRRAAVPRAAHAASGVASGQAAGASDEDDGECVHESDVPPVPPRMNAEGRQGQQPDDREERSRPAVRQRLVLAAGEPASRTCFTSRARAPPSAVDRADDKVPVEIQASAQELIADGLEDRDAFAREELLVDGGRPRLDGGVDGDPFPRGPRRRSPPDLGDRDLFCPVSIGLQPQDAVGEEPLELIERSLPRPARGPCASSQRPRETRTRITQATSK